MLRDMLPWQIEFIRYKNPDLQEATLFVIHKEFKKTNWKSKESQTFLAGWKRACTILNVRFADLLPGTGQAKYV